jgi:hypothetical protein
MIPQPPLHGLVNDAHTAIDGRRSRRSSIKPSLASTTPGKRQGGVAARAPCAVISWGVEALDKPKYRWCQHCKPGKGCSIYGNRPAVCKTFACMWLIQVHVGDHWYSLKSKMVLDLQFKNDEPHPVLHVIVDPRYPNRWREERTVPTSSQWP